MLKRKSLKLEFPNHVLSLRADYLLKIWAIAVFVASCFVSQQLLASGAHIGINTMRINQKVDGTTVGDAEQTDFWTEYKLGYLWDTWYIGGNSSNFETTSSTGASSSTSRRNALGATFGYRNNGFFIDGTYYMQATYKLSSGTELTEGTGIGIDFGYQFQMSGAFYLGLEIASRSWDFKKREVAGTTTTESNKVTELLPMINLGFIF